MAVTSRLNEWPGEPHAAARERLMAMKKGRAQVRRRGHSDPNGLVALLANLADLGGIFGAETCVHGA